MVKFDAVEIVECFGDESCTGAGICVDAWVGAGGEASGTGGGACIGVGRGSGRGVDITGSGGRLNLCNCSRFSVPSVRTCAVSTARAGRGEEGGGGSGSGGRTILRSRSLRSISSVRIRSASAAL